MKALARSPLGCWCRQRARLAPFRRTRRFARSCASASRCRGSAWAASSRWWTNRALAWFRTVSPRAASGGRSMVTRCSRWGLSPRCSLRCCSRRWRHAAKFGSTTRSPSTRPRSSRQRAHAKSRCCICRGTRPGSCRLPTTSSRPPCRTLPMRPRTTRCSPPSICNRCARPPACTTRTRAMALRCSENSWRAARQRTSSRPCGRGSWSR